MKVSIFGINYKKSRLYETSGIVEKQENNTCLYVPKNPPGYLMPDMSTKVSLTRIMFFKDIYKIYYLAQKILHFFV
jgi:hypothetical protein